jgi:hypothetical protein
LSSSVLTRFGGGDSHDFQGGLPPCAPEGTQVFPSLRDSVVCAHKLYLPTCAYGADSFADLERVESPVFVDRTLGSSLPLLPTNLYVSTAIADLDHLVL